jgi:hypothetical protein
VPTPLTRYLVLAPTLLLSWAMSLLGYAPLTRLTAGLCLGAVLIVLVSRYQRRRALGSSS